jgi:predicted glutamine amidotransferase
MAAILNVTDKNRKDAGDLSANLAHHMTQTEQDGFGAALMNDKGEHFIERWLEPHEVFDYRELVPTIPEEYKVLLDGPSIKQRYNREGKPEVWSDYTGITLHARMATCGVSLENTHPFIRDNKILSHNGVVTASHSKAYNVTSTCDSEMLLNLYGDNDYVVEPVFEGVDGYQACLVFDTVKKTLHVWRDDKARLSIAELSNGLIVLATSAEHIELAAADTDLTVLWSGKLKDYVEAVFALNGEVISQRKLDIKHKPPKLMNKVERHALGYDYQDDLPNASEDPEAIKNFLEQQYNHSVECKACKDSGFIPKKVGGYNHYKKCHKCDAGWNQKLS